MNFHPVSEMGCKDTDFLITCKFFRNFFQIISLFMDTTSRRVHVFKPGIPSPKDLNPSRLKAVPSETVLTWI